MRVVFNATEMRFPVRLEKCDRSFPVGFKGYIGGGAGEIYPGPYEVTPSRETQELLTDGYQMDGNVTVYPIPSNYGLITYNGYELTVS